MRRYQFLQVAALLLFSAWIFQKAILLTLAQGFEEKIRFVAENSLYSTFSALTLGLALYAFREKYKFYYGLIEVSFSAALTYVLILHLESNGLAGLLAVGGAVYVTVRGIDNMYTGFKSPKLYYKEPQKADKDNITENS
ncbi:hypothetical protein [Pseudomonas fluorescens]|nr:hypothetical protein [Pseudomonas fluorescens]